MPKEKLKSPLDYPYLNCPACEAPEFYTVVDKPRTFVCKKCGKSNKALAWAQTGLKLHNQKVDQVKTKPPRVKKSKAQGFQPVDEQMFRVLTKHVADNISKTPGIMRNEELSILVWQFEHSDQTNPNNRLVFYETIMESYLPDWVKFKFWARFKLFYGVRQLPKKAIRGLIWLLKWMAGKLKSDFICGYETKPYRPEGLKEGETWYKADGPTWKWLVPRDQEKSSFDGPGKKIMSSELAEKADGNK